MRNRPRWVRRRAVLAAAGLLAAGALTGCKTGGTPFAYAGVARGDVGCAPASPALAHAAAGQHLDLKYVPGAPTTVLPTPDGATMGMPPGQPIVGSGGVVYPIGSAPAGGPITPASMPGPTVAAPAPGVMPFQSVPTLVAQGGASLPTYSPSTVGQQMILLVNGPNGPQYVIAEVMGSAPAPVPAMPIPVMPAAGTMPAAPAAPSAPMKPASFAPAPEPLPAPTFNAPPPPAIPMPAMPPGPPSAAPAVVPVDMGAKAADPKPLSGPILPAAGTAAPALESSPAPLPPGQFRAAKLPAATGVTDEDIPAAPVFVPVPK